MWSWEQKISRFPQKEGAGEWPLWSGWGGGLGGCVVLGLERTWHMRKKGAGGLFLELEGEPRSFGEMRCSLSRLDAKLETAKPQAGRTITRVLGTWLPNPRRGPAFGSARAPSGWQGALSWAYSAHAPSPMPAKVPESSCPCLEEPPSLLRCYWRSELPSGQGLADP